MANRKILLDTADLMEQFCTSFVVHSWSADKILGTTVTEGVGSIIDRCGQPTIQLNNSTASKDLLTPEQNTFEKEEKNLLFCLLILAQVWTDRISIYNYVRSYTKEDLYQ